MTIQEFKTFGKHRVPEGWLVVTAGNPPEYNKSVREFDLVTLDRLKLVAMEPDFAAWKEYAYQAGVHAAVLTYLEIKPQHFYSVETTPDGTRFVTARGWEDLSQMLLLCEQAQITVEQKLVGQYLQHPKIARDFAAYYDLFRKYQADYQIEAILAGTADERLRERARAARFDERLALLGLCLERITTQARLLAEQEEALAQLLTMTKTLKEALAQPRADALQLVTAELEARQAKLAQQKQAAPTATAPREQQALIALLLEQQSLLAADAPADNAAAFALLRGDLARRLADHQEAAEQLSRQVTQLFCFCEQVFADGQELLILVTELTVNAHTARFISAYGCAKYFEHNRELLFYERQQELAARLSALDLSQL